MPISLTTAAAITDIDAPVSTSPSMIYLFISTGRWSALLLLVLFTQIRLIAGTGETTET